MNTLLLLALLVQAPDPALVESAVVEGSEVRLLALRSKAQLRLDSGEDAARERYLLAYLNWRVSQTMGKDRKKQKTRLLKEAQGQLESLLKANAADAEAHALRGTVIGERINGALKGMFLGPKAGKALDRAHELAPDNPRVALQRGISMFFTPKSFGGGVSKAEAELRRALTLFGDENPETPWPNWGRVDALAWLGQTLLKQDRPAEARKLYEKALSIEPNHTWIRDVLLPAADLEGG